MASEIWVQAVIAVPATIGATAAYMHARSASREVQGNGQGTVTKMLEKLLVKDIETRAALRAHVKDRRSHL